MEASRDERAATESPAVHPAGEGIDDQEMIDEVAGQTSPDLKAQETFKREAGGAVTDKPIEEAGAEDLRG